MKEINIKNEGYIFCKSSFYSVLDILENQTFDFTVGINKLVGEIDSGIFGISYLISMYDSVDKKSIFLPLEAKVDGINTKLSELAKQSCYMDVSYPLFSSNKSTISLIGRGLKKSKLPYTVNDIINMFDIQSKNHLRSIKQTGNEKIKIMAAVGFAFGKEIFCFPWMSKTRYKSFNKHIDISLNILSKNNKIVILPIGN